MVRIVRARLTVSLQVTVCIRQPRSIKVYPALFERGAVRHKNHQITCSCLRGFVQLSASISNLKLPLWLWCALDVRLHARLLVQCVEARCEISPYHTSPTFLLFSKLLR